MFLKKILLLFFIIAISLNIFSQNDSICNILPVRNGLVTFENIVKIEGIDAKTLYKNSKVWIAKEFVNSKSVTESDIENTLLTISGILVKSENINYSFKMTLQFKDGRFKYSLSNIQLHMTFAGSRFDKNIEDLPACKVCKTETLTEIKDIFMGVVDNLSSNLKANNDDW